jgi:hypothetical protein
VPGIVFTTRLTEADWDDTLRGWRCPPLAVPGAIVEALYIEGNRIDTARYEVLSEQAVIRWTLSDQPQRAAAMIRLTEKLTLGAETDRWKKLAIVLPVSATIISAGIAATATWLAKPAPPTQSVAQRAPPVVPSPSPSTPVPSGSDSEEIGGTNMSKSTEVTLGQPIRGFSTGNSSELRWFKFSVVDKDPVQVSIVFKNLRQTGDLSARVYDAQKHQILEGLARRFQFVSPTPDVYYLAVSDWGSAVLYELTVTAQ